MRTPGIWYHSTIAHDAIHGLRYLGPIFGFPIIINGTDAPQKPQPLSLIPEIQPHPCLHAWGLSGAATRPAPRSSTGERVELLVL